MAGAGFKTFNTGDVLTASDVNTYLMQQTVMVFADATARSTALGANVAEGMLSYLKDTNTTAYYDGSAWQNLSTGGDITGVTAGTGISGGGISGDVTITNSMATAIDAQGDLIAGTGADTFSRLAVGSNGTVLLADSAEATGLRWGRIAQIGCSLYKTADQSCGDNATTVITWDAENFDTNAFHDNTTNNSRITIPSGLGGKYLFTCTQTWLTSSSGMRELGLRKNGSTFLMYVYISPNSLEMASGTLSIVVNAAAGDYFEITGRQRTGGGSLSVDGGAANTSEFGCTFLGA